MTLNKEEAASRSGNDNLNPTFLNLTPERKEMTSNKEEAVSISEDDEMIKKTECEFNFNREGKDESHL